MADHKFRVRLILIVLAGMGMCWVGGWAEYRILMGGSDLLSSFGAAVVFAVFEAIGFTLLSSILFPQRSPRTALRVWLLFATFLLVITHQPKTSPSWTRIAIPIGDLVAWMCLLLWLRHRWGKDWWYGVNDERASREGLGESTEPKTL